MTAAVLGAMPTDTTLVMERFFDDADGMLARAKNMKSESGRALELYQSSLRKAERTRDDAKSRRDGFAQKIEEIDAIANNPEPPTFENTIVALEDAGRDLDRAQVYYRIWSGNVSSPESSYAASISRVPSDRSRSSSERSRPRNAWITSATAATGERAA